MDADARLTVRVPLRCSRIAIQHAVEKHETWITKKQKHAREHYKPYCAKTFLEGEKFLYLGNLYPLSYADDGDSGLKYDGRQFTIGSKTMIDAKKLFENWYRWEASQIIKDRTSHYSKITGIIYRNIRITGAGRRWGSCSHFGDLNFTWRLAMAPLEVIDSVVVHELMHVEIKGHRNGFWERVKNYLPDLESRRKWLKENQNLLFL